MKKVLFIIAISLIILSVMTACGQNQEDVDEDGQVGSDKIQVVTTYSILYDMVKNVGGDLVDIHSLAPIGSNPHEYTPRPLDVQKATDADVVFYNGLNLEAGNSWFAELMETAGKTGEDAPVYRLSEGVEPMYLTTKGKEGEEDPHAWLSMLNGIQYAENAKQALMEVDPDNADRYEEQADSYIAKLQALHEKALQQFSDIPVEDRIIVTSEGAFKYFSAAYGIEGEYIWEINQENQGTPEQVTRIIDLIREREIKGLFLETSIDPRSMETVSQETDVPIKGKVFTDSLGKPGEDGDTYIKMMEWNLETIYNGLKGE